MNKRKWREVIFDFPENYRIGDIELIQAIGTGVEVGKFLKEIQNIESEKHE